MKAKANLKLIAILLGFAAVVCGLCAALAVSAVKLAYPIKYGDLVKKYSEEYQVPENLLLAVIRTESSFDPLSVSSAGAKGLTQITADTFLWLQTKTGETLAEDELFDEETAIKYGAFFLGLLLEEFDDSSTAVAAYHAGRGRVNSWLSDAAVSPDGKSLENIPVPETAHYVRKVTRAVNIYNKLNPPQDGLKTEV